MSVGSVAMGNGAKMDNAERAPNATVNVAATSSGDGRATDEIAEEVCAVVGPNAQTERQRPPATRPKELPTEISRFNLRQESVLRNERKDGVLCHSHKQ